MNRRAISTALALVVSLAQPVWAETPPPPPPPAPDGLKLETFTLKNGLRAVVIPNHRVPAVSHALWYRFGAADDPAGKSGLAHFVEHMMFQGSKTIAPGEFSKIVSRNGGRDNAFTSNDYTAFFQNIAKEHLPMVMRMEAERLGGGLKLAQKEFDNEKNVILEERKMRVDNEPVSQLYEQMNAALYLNHPYGRPVIGWEHEIQSTTLPDIQAFYRQHYCPGNATLVVAGDVKLEEVKLLAERAYGSIPACPEVQKHRPQEPKHLTARRLTLTHTEARQPRLVRKYLLPSAAYEGRNEHALSVLAFILGDPQTGRFYRTLAVEKKLVSQAGSYVNDVSVDPADFTIDLTPAAGQELAVVERGLDEALAALLATGVTEEELTRTKNRLVAEEVYAREGLFHLARITGELFASGRDATYLREWSQRIQMVNAADVLAVAKLVFDANASVTAALLPAAPVEKPAPTPTPATGKGAAK